MTEITRSEAITSTRAVMSKVPEVTVWFWVIKILCTTVGESFADWINMTLGVGLVATSLIFTVVLVAVLGWQLRLTRYVPLPYWLTVVLVSVTGTLYTDILTDNLGVPLALSTTVFAVALAVVFGVWFARERTLSIHSITTRGRELFYWLAVLVTFALGTASGDWILELTGWGPGTSVLLPAGLIAGIVVGWRLGANAVLSFWLAYILTRPLGANLGDWLGMPPDQQGVGLGVAITSLIFLAAILVIVLYLSITRADVIDHTAGDRQQSSPTNPQRELVMLGYYAVLAVAATVLLGWAAGQPHTASTASEAESGPTAAALAPGQSATAKFPTADVARFRAIVDDTVTRVQAGDQTGATTRVKDLETAWDDAQPTLQPLDGTGWSVLDGQIDDVLTALRADRPDPATETQTLTALQVTLVPGG
ncbi:hypothetical protein [Mycolicibacterium sp. YH-1]|uniref:COG4705 family protein n=1 Tax=Mycolicibacterium sp. YH-1 TaxID=2908837 RepID=UPI001F4C4FF4|nr:hypothetical protein [Mycolicibacterium sp. YH-1]UNB49845.1 hypothetical protein L0M16_17650 [Mycolicibacterium sp. YH-1]